jgi:hypothetical protein
VLPPSALFSEVKKRISPSASGAFTEIVALSVLCSRDVIPLIQISEAIKLEIRICM